MSTPMLIAYFTLFSIFNIYWLITYVLVIRRGFMEKTWGIPMISLTLNLAWDISGSFILPSPFSQKLANMIFVTANLIITYQMFRYWRSDFKQLSSFEFFGFWALAQVASFFIIIIGSQELNDPLIVEMGYVDNFINSALFIAMLYRREGLQGQSIYIGLSKMIGILVLDLVYVAGVYARAKKLGIDVWRRW